MSIGAWRAAKTLIVIALSFISTLTYIKASPLVTVEIDLFTQKEPYSGRGPHMPSDAFSPGELVILYALVTYDGAPLQHKLVAFCVQMPNKTSFSLVAVTNVTGIATVNFTIPQACPSYEVGVFGKWFTLAKVLIKGEVFQDTLTFAVGWIVKIVSIRTVEWKAVYRGYFGIKGDVGLEIVLRSIAMVWKNATLALVIKDEASVPISFLQIQDFEVPPMEKLVLLYCKLPIPKWAVPGNATALASALTAPVKQLGVAYAPTLTTGFLITIPDPISLVFRDVAVINVVPSAVSVVIGQLLSVKVVVRNEGTEVESFNVSLRLGNVDVGVSEVVALKPYSAATLEFVIDTAKFAVGNYTLSARIQPLIDEVDVADNEFIFGIIEIKPLVPVIIHDVAVTNVTVQKTVVYIGELLRIYVDVVNYGNVTETFNVTTYYVEQKVEYPIETILVIDLEPKAKRTLTSVWNTSLVREGLYMIKAEATLPPPLVDVNPLNNVFEDGIVQVKAPPPKFYYLTVRTEPPEVIKIAPIHGEGWHPESAKVPLAATMYVPALPGVRFRFSHWTVDDVPYDVGVCEITVHMDRNRTAIAYYVKQYYLTVKTHPPKVVVIPGEGWYDQCENVTLTAPPVVNWYDFKYWDVDGVPGDPGVNVITVHMDRPRTVTAHYVIRVIVWFYWFFLAFVILIIILLAIWFYRKMRRPSPRLPF